jgi:hypothetical protein
MQIMKRYPIKYVCPFWYTCVTVIFQYNVPTAASAFPRIMIIEITNMFRLMRFFFPNFILFLSVICLTTLITSMRERIFYTWTKETE